MDSLIEELVPARRRSHTMGDLLSQAQALPVGTRRDLLHSLDPEVVAGLLVASESQLGTAFALWQDDPVGFIVDVLGETLWSRQRRVAKAVVEHRRVAVPSAFGTGKTFLSGRLAVWYASVHPPGTALVVTTAPYIRQVHRQVWPHIRKVRAKAGLPGEAGAMQWKMPNNDGIMVVVAYGVSAPHYDPEALQGIHAARLLLLVDEAGNISQTIGRSIRALLTGEHTRMLAIGNPPMDDPGSWFETLCTTEGVTTLPISAYDTPNMTGEDVGACKDCPPEVPAHPLSEHLVDEEWVQDTLLEHGDNSPFVESKIWARFPKSSSSRIIPGDWVGLAVEAAMSLSPEPGTFAQVADDQGRPYDAQPRPGPVVLGVDVAADGGDEFVVARKEGDLIRVVHAQAGAANSNAVEVAGTVLRHILLAEQIRAAWSVREPVEVRVDAIGIGWGVVSVLEAWRSEGLHAATIIRVVVSETPAKKDDTSTLWRPMNKRAEMWIAGRLALAPTDDGLPATRLDVDPRTAAQLSEPSWYTTTSGKVAVESKDAMKKRGVRSPDRAEAVLLTLYGASRRKVRVLAA